MGGGVCLLLVAMVLLPAGGALVAQEIAPGGVAVWSGGGASRCGQDETTWNAIDGDCWFPVDLLESRAELELSRWSGDVRESRTIRVSTYPYEVQYIELEDDSKVDLSQEDLARVRRESGSIAALWDLSTPRRFSLPLAAPLERLPEGGRFGSRRFFNQQPRSPHTGADYSAAEGVGVLATAAGTVALTGDFFFSGGSVFIDHGDGLVSMYFHLSDVDLAQGDRVERGQRLGAVGSTGRATGPHLHFGVRWRGARVDPELLLASPDRLPRVE